MRQSRVIVEALNGFVEFIVKALVLATVANLVRAPSEGGTPVDTGWARVNWIPEIGKERSAPAGSRAAAEAGNLPGEQQTALAAVTTGYTLDRGAVYITNAVPYIIPLNEGHSQQAPSGFVQANVAKAVTVDLPALLAGGAGQKRRRGR